MYFPPLFFVREWPESPKLGAPWLESHRHNLSGGPDINHFAADEARVFLLSTGRAWKRAHFTPSFDVIFAPSFTLESDLNRPNSEPRVLNLIAITYPEALTSIFLLLMKRKSFFYRPEEFDYGLILRTPSFDVYFPPSFSLESDLNRPN